jgi:DNA-binding response OmpR family regulator
MPRNDAPSSGRRALLAAQAQHFERRLAQVAQDLAFSLQLGAEPQVLDALGRGDVEVFFLDVLLPGQGGMALCAQIKRERPEARVFLLSDLLTDDQFVKQDLRRVQADGFFPRDASLDVVRAALVSWAARPPAPRPKLLLWSRDLRAGHALAAAAERDGWSFEQVTGEPEAQARLAEGVALCVVDGAEGGALEFCAQAPRAAPEGARVSLALLCDPWADLETLQRGARRSGVDELLCKPFGLDGARDLLRVYHHPRGEPDAPFEGGGLLRHTDDVGLHMSRRLCGPQEGARGDLSRCDLSALLYKLAHQRKTGELELTRGDLRRTLALVLGRLVWVSPGSPHDHLGDILVERKLLTREQATALSDHHKDDAAREAELLRRRALTAGQLDEAKRELVRRRALECFELQDGAWRWSAHEPATPARFEQDTWELLREAVDRVCTANRLAQLLEGLSARVVLKTGLWAAWSPQFPLQEREQLWLQRLDGHTTLGAMLQPGGLDVNHALRLLWALYHARLVLFHDAPQPEVAERPRAGKDPSDPMVAAVPDPRSGWERLFGEAERRAGQPPQGR